MPWTSSDVLNYTRTSQLLVKELNVTHFPWKAIIFRLLLRTESLINNRIAATRIARAAFKVRSKAWDYQSKLPGVREYRGFHKIWPLKVKGGRLLIEATAMTSSPARFLDDFTTESFRRVEMTDGHLIIKSPMDREEAQGPDEASFYKKSFDLCNCQAQLNICIKPLMEMLMRRKEAKLLEVFQ